MQWFLNVVHKVLQKPLSSVALLLHMTVSIYGRDVITDYQCAELLFD